jgi:hypothetical protein
MANVGTVLAAAPVALKVAKEAYKLYKKDGVKKTAEKYGQKVTKYLKDEFPELAGPPKRIRKDADRSTDLPKEKAFVEPRSTAAKAGRRRGDYLTKSEGMAREARAKETRRAIGKTATATGSTGFLNPREKSKASKSKPFTGKDRKLNPADMKSAKEAAQEVGLPFKKGGSPIRKKAKR